MCFHFPSFNSKKKSTNKNAAQNKSGKEKIRRIHPSRLCFGRFPFLHKEYNFIQIRLRLRFAVSACGKAVKGFFSS
jgi:hypothetical protein